MDDVSKEDQKFFENMQSLAYALAEATMIKRLLDYQIENKQLQEYVTGQVELSNGCGSTS